MLIYLGMVHLRMRIVLPRGAAMPAKETIEVRTYFMRRLTFFALSGVGVRTTLDSKPLGILSLVRSAFCDGGASPTLPVENSGLIQFRSMSISDALTSESSAMSTAIAVIGKTYVLAASPWNKF